jgi:germination protein M
MRRRPFLVVLALVLLVAACGDDGGDDGGTTTSTAPAPAPTITTPGTVPATDVSALVFFTRDGKVATAGRAVEPPAVARGALEALLEGPDDFEAGLGMTNAIPEGTRLLDIGIDGGVATVNLSGAFLSDIEGPIALQVAQVVFTLTQFPTVDRVTIQIEGASAPSIGLDAVPVMEVDRSDFVDETPLILVEYPAPGAAVTSPVEVSGLSNTFEANVLYEVTDGEGTVVDDGFTTATSGTGTWGTFSFNTDLDAGDVVITVFQESAEDGSRTDVYPVPVHVG